MNWLDWTIVLCLNGAVIAYGFYRARGTESSSEWFLGGRALPWWGLGLSMFATSVDNADIVSLSGHSYNHGMHIVAVYTVATVLGASVSAFFVVPMMYRAGFYTNAEFLESRFSSSLRAFSALIQIQYRSAVLGLMVWSMNLLLQRLVGLSSGESWTLIGALVLLTAAYTVWGGLTSVVWTDALQSVIILVGAGCIFLTVWNAVDGWDGLLARIEQAEPVTLADGKQATSQPLAHWLHIGQFEDPGVRVPPAVIVLGWCIIGVGYYTVNHTQTMRLLGARSLWDMQMASLLGCVLTCPIMVGTILLGVFGRVLFPDFTRDGTTSDELFPALADRYLVPGMKGLVVAGIVSAAVSTFDSIGSALSALFTRDIYARWIRTDADDAHYVTVTRWATLGILLLGFLYVPFIAGKNNMVEALISLVPVFVTPLFTIYLLGAVTRVHAQSGLVGLVCGGLFGVLGFIDREVTDLTWLSPTVTANWPALPCAMAVTALSMGLTTLVLGRAPLDVIVRQQESGWLASSRAQLSEFRDHPFEGDVPLWLQPRWYALGLLVISAWAVFGFFW